MIAQSYSSAYCILTCFVRVPTSLMIQICAYESMMFTNSFTAPTEDFPRLLSLFSRNVLLVHVFACRPIAKVWNPALEGSCINVNVFFSIYEPINSAIDFVMAGMAIWMVRGLRLKRQIRWHLSVLFLIGGLYELPLLIFTYWL